MEYTTLGETGTSVSRICLGCLPFGRGPGGSAGWRLDAEESRAIIERAIDLGVNFFDTANSYGRGASERVLGSVLAEYDRDDLVVATKVFNPPAADPHPNATGLSRKTIEQELANSLARLGMETVDLYQVHRWDHETPIEGTLRALDDAVRRGRVRYLGASSMWAHQFASALSTADALGLDRFATMQDHYNLVYREEEREMLPLCDREGIGVLPWSPLARGYLARPHDAFETTARARRELDEKPGRQAIYRRGGGREINERVAELAGELDATMAQVALAWLLQSPWVDAPVVGTTSVEHVEEAAAAVELDLSADDVAYLEAPYEPVPVSGHD